MTPTESRSGKSASARQPRWSLRLWAVACCRAASVALALGSTGLALAAGPAADKACPPSPQQPSEEQMQTAQREARDRGFLWRITKDGRSSYLFGTLHVGKLPWIFAGPALRDALAQTDTLALELDVTDPALMRDAPSVASKPMPISAALRARLARQIAAACVQADALQALHPVMQAITLTVLAARWDGLDPSYAQEVVLAGAARALQRPIVSLESVQSQLAVLLPADKTQARHLLEQALEQLEQGRTRPLLRRLADAWSEGRLDEIEKYTQWCECADTAADRTFMRQLNDERNAPMAARIDAMHAQGQRVLAAVGALHMTGERGLPRLMAARGYTVERLLPR